MAVKSDYNWKKKKKSPTQSKDNSDGNSGNQDSNEVVFERYTKDFPY